MANKRTAKKKTKRVTARKRTNGTPTKTTSRARKNGSPQPTPQPSSDPAAVTISANVHQAALNFLGTLQLGTVMELWVALKKLPVTGDVVLCPGQVYVELMRCLEQSQPVILLWKELTKAAGGQVGIAALVTGAPAGSTVDGPTEDGRGLA